ncbi:hypothetical protein KC340_g4745 [Hortaea werneckii]|nr:hypothetical protein KC342_g5211 [Hortaea werneckii]KAI7101362.1 hypothetical protein KC339_g6784 [Hortaea werneckii]KAI7241754.1 hypothetical protein KC365_g3438 [Hortaea werneckii]KAI7329244.1 hypothetical protein KC340_g4745 [Hortaea werneckii]KAI7392259.1 hypothetical protein KC328_g7135 [Hortaea werneckii]
MRYWFGENFKKYEKRIHDIVKRARNWYGSSSNNIWMHCGDPKKICKKKKTGSGLRPIGGYAWTDFGWFWNNQHMALCKPFFGKETIDDRVQFLDEKFRIGVDEYIHYARDMNWLETRGSFFLHEMFHLDFVDKAGGEKSKDHVTDCMTRESWDPLKRGDVLAYGPKGASLLASNGVEKNGGAYWASRNADSFVQALNAVYWYQETGVLPEAEGRNYFAAGWDDDTSANKTDAPPLPIMVQLGNMTGNDDFLGAAESALAVWENSDG